MSHPTLTEEVKNKARSLGFDAVGIAPAAPLVRAEQALRERTGSGLLTDYGFSTDRVGEFTHPEKLIEGAKSVIVAALSYLSPENPPDSEPGKPRGRVARFARGEDYHAVVTGKLQRLAEWLKERTGAESRVCVDTGPVIDRALAERAGVGWYGKNTNLITPQHGSWVVLGELVTQAELGPDEPAEFDKCGDCRVCIESCPTGAIVAPFVIDTRRCISHLTQMKGYIPRDLRPLMGDRIYGCDVCQEVCPQNVDVRSTESPELGREAAPGRAPELIRLLNISAAGFNRLIESNTMGWIRRTRFRRNVAVALGNLKDPAAVMELTKALSDPEPIIRAHSAWALGQIGTPEAVAALRRALQTEQDERVTEEIRSSL